MRTLVFVFLCLIFASCYGAEKKDKGPFTADDCAKDILENTTRSCFAAIPIFHWNNEKKECEGAIYGGCGASRNVFYSLEDCKKAAEPLCK